MQSKPKQKEKEAVFEVGHRRKPKVEMGIGNRSKANTNVERRKTALGAEARPELMQYRCADDTEAKEVEGCYEQVEQRKQR